MKSEVLFAEKQKFSRWWLWLTLVAVDGFFLFGVFKQVVKGEQFGNKPLSNAGLLLATGLAIGLTLLLVSLRLDTEIRTDGIYVRFFPFHLRFRRYTWDLLKKSYVRQYSALTEYGGWGLRLGLFGKGKAYCVSGNKGLQLEFADHKKLLIGTQKPDELTETLQKIGQSA